MTQTNEKAKALKHVREVCGLCHNDGWDEGDECYPAHLENFIYAIHQADLANTTNIIIECGGAIYTKDERVIMCNYDTTKDGDNQSPEFYQAYNKITS